MDDNNNNFNLLSVLNYLIGVFVSDSTIKKLMKVPVTKSTREEILEKLDLTKMSHDVADAQQFEEETKQLKVERLRGNQTEAAVERGIK